MRTPPTTLTEMLNQPPREKGGEIRLTIPVTPEVHEAFTRIAKAASMPVGRAMGEWLADTVDAANFMAATMEKARAAPKLVAQELHAYALGLGDETGELLKKMREKGRTPGGGDALASARREAGPTPPSNTGVTNTKNKPKGGTDGRRKDQH